MDNEMFATFRSLLNSSGEEFIDAPHTSHSPILGASCRCSRAYAFKPVLTSARRSR